MRAYRYVIFLLAALTCLSLPLPAAYAEPLAPDSSACLYPSPTDRFGVTVYAEDEISYYNVTNLGAGRYLNWRADLQPLHPVGMAYYLMLRVNDTGGYWPSGNQLTLIVRNNPGSTWIIGNEADVIWQDNTSPASYVRAFHDATTAIKAIDPTARFVISGIVQVSPLRLAWLEEVWNTYRSTYGVDMPVDVWNIHTYVANEMHQQWGFEIPSGIKNAVGYSNGLGTDWALLADAAASGGTVHQSRTPGANAYFAFRGSQVTLYLHTGPDAGIAKLYLDQSATPVTEVDLYASTPGTLTRSYTNLPPVAGLINNRHNIRVQVTGNKNPASTNTWVRVDAISAFSTATLPNGRFEDNNPLRARIETTVENHDNLDLITQQIRDFRQWMANHGQRNKPLIDTEYGILMTEDVGFTYQRVRTFMLNSFNRFLNQLTDPALGYPADDNRLLQEWFWFALANNDFEGRLVHTGLFNPVTYQIKPLGIDYRNYTQPLAQNYVDLETYGLTITPYWPIFSGEPSLLRAEGSVRNRGNQASAPFVMTFRAGNNTVLSTQPLAGLARRFEPGSTAAVQYDWRIVTTAPRSMALIADEADQVAEPCASNNSMSVQVVPPAGVDLALSNLVTNPSVLPSAPPGAVIDLELKVDLANLGMTGAAASQVVVKLWHGNPAAGGQVVATQTIARGNAPLPVQVTLQWPARPAGVYELYAQVEPVAEETNLVNNVQHLTVVVLGSKIQFPNIQRLFRRDADTEAGDASLAPAWTTLDAIEAMLPAAP